MKAYDPVAPPRRERSSGSSVAYAETLDECVTDVDAVVLVTRWRQFESVPALTPMQSPPLLLDGRRQLDKRKLARYAGIGL